MWSRRSSGRSRTSMTRRSRPCSSPSPTAAGTPMRAPSSRMSPRRSMCGSARSRRMSTLWAASPSSSPGACRAPARCWNIRAAGDLRSPTATPVACAGSAFIPRRSPPRPLRRLAMIRLRAALLALPLLLAGCGDHARLNIAETSGPAPQIPPPVSPAAMLIPTIHIAQASHWPAGAMPVAAPGLRVTPFATGLDHPRWLLVLPNGDVLVAETSAPPPDPGYEDHSIKGYFFHLFEEKAGSAVPSANRITLLRDANGDGVAEL